MTGGGTPYFMDERAAGRRETFKFSEVLSALSFVLDKVEGQPEGHVVRSCFVGMTIANGLGLAQDQRSALFYALLLKDAGCSSTSSGVAGLFEADDFEVKKTLKTTDRSRLPESLLYVARTVSPGGNLRTRARRFLAVGMEGRRANRRLVRIRCERGAEIARLIGFPEATVRAIPASTNTGTVPDTLTASGERRYRSSPGCASWPRPSIFLHLLRLVSGRRGCPNPSQKVVRPCARRRLSG
jgi:hypothetical protein